MTLHLSLLLFSFLFRYSHASNPDLHPLHAFKSSSDPTGSLSSWAPTSDPCSGSWLGVSCSRGRVTSLVLENLNLTGSIQTLTLLPFLSLLSLKNNSISSSLHLLSLSPWRPHLKLLFLSNNRISGQFPREILLLRHLRRLDLAGNHLSGGIPTEIGQFLPQLLTLRLERNSFSGNIPISLGSISGLSDLNLSHNRLIGEIPSPISFFPPSSFAGNLDLLFPNRTAARADPAPNSSGRKRKWMVMAFSIAILASATIMAAAGLLFLKKRRNGRGKIGGIEGIGAGDDGYSKGKEDEEGVILVLFEGCRGFVMEDLMRGSAEMLGRGVVGSTYRVVMEGAGGGEGVVVKRVRRKRMRNNKEEVAAEERFLKEIGGWRHPNVVRLLAYCSSEDELLLVVDYLPNGSLHSLLHGTCDNFCPYGSHVSVVVKVVRNISAIVS